MALDFPSSPTNGQTFVSGSRTWTYNTTTSSWEASSIATSKTANYVYAAPNGSAGIPDFRALVAADLPNTAVTAGSYTYSSITVDAQGRITAASNGTAPVTSVTGTAPIISSGGTTPDISISAATTSAAGSMSAADKTKLNSVATNANNYTLPKATANELGGVEVFSATVQTTAANAVTSTASRTYGVQLNAADQMVVNVPWVDTTNTGTVTSVGGTGTVSGLTLSGTVTSSGNLTLGGTLSLTSSNVTTALGFTPYNATNPSNYITASALTPYALLSGATFTGSVSFPGGSNIATNGDIYARRSSGTTGVYYFADGGSKYLFWDGGQYVFGNAGPATITTSFRAPLFYDSNDTTYYTGPATNSILNTTFVNRYFQRSSGVPTNNLGDPTVTEMALFEEQFNNKTAFFPPANVICETSTDGTNWTLFAVSDSVKKNLVGGTSGTGLGIPYGTVYFRVRFVNDGNYVYLNALYSSWSGNGHSTKVQIHVKAFGSTTWTQHTNSTTEVSSWPGHLYLPFSTIAYHPGTYTDQVAVVFQPTWNASFPSNSISLQKMQIWGGYPQGRRTGYSIDADKNYTFPSDVRATLYYDSGNTGYYIDPAGTSNVSGITLDGTLTGVTGRFRKNQTAGNYTTAALWTESYGSTATGIAFHISGNVGKFLEMRTDQILYWNGTLNTDAMSAPIYYDRDNTAYYTDPASTSILRGLTLTDGSPAMTFSSTTSSRTAAFGMTDAYNMYLNAPTNGVLYLSNFQAPIMYDRDNSNYYTDPASTTVLNALTVNGGNVYRSDWTTGFQSSSDFANGTLVTTDIPATASAGDSFIIEITGKSYDGSNPPFKVIAQGYLYNDTIINYSGASYAGNFSSYLKVFQDGGVLKFWWPRISYWNSFNVSVKSMDGQTNGTITRNRVTAIGNSTEPTGTKKQQINLASFMRSDVSATNSDGRIYLNNSTNNFIIASAGTSSALYMEARGGGFRVRDAGSGSSWFTALNGTCTATTDSRAPIFYDNDNTAFFFDGASTTNINTLNGNGKQMFTTADSYLRMNEANGFTNGIWMSNSNFGGGAGTLHLGSNGDPATSRIRIIGGTYNGSTVITLNGADGSIRATKTTADNTPAIQVRGGNPGYPRIQTYGLDADAAAWMGLGTDMGGGSYEHSVYFPNGSAGNGRLSIGDYNGTTYNPRLWVYTSYTQINNSTRSPLFYDSDNTGFYINPNGDTNLNRTFSYLGGKDTNANWNTGFQNTPAASYNYHGDLNGGTNAPAAGWWIYESMRHSNASNYWGTQVAWGWEDNSNRLMQRNVSGNSFSAWVEYLSTGGRTYSGNLNITGSIISTASDVRAPIFYDQDNTGYYVNAAGTSYINALNIGPTANGASYLNINGYNAYGGTGYHGFLTLYNTYSSATNPQQFWRLNAAGGFEIVNSPYNAVLFTFTQGGDFTAAGNVTAYSDRKLKANFEPIENALSKVLQLNGVTFTRIDKEDATIRYAGLIAQDVEVALPEAVQSNETMSYGEVKSVDYNATIALLVEAIKEQQSHITKLEEKLNKLLGE